MEPYKDSQATFSLVTEKGFPHGIKCMKCKRTLPNGSPYAERLVAMQDEDVICHTVCVYCGVEKQ